MIFTTMPPTTFTTTDGISLEGEIEIPDRARAGLVICHPHPLHGGSMRSVVVGGLYEGLPARGVACLRFNFRGVEGSEGAHAGGEGERLDVEAALAHLRDALPEGTPVALAGWSFGADVALSVRGGHAGWFLVAPPLKFADDPTESAADPRPKRLVLAQHDQYRDPAEVQAETATWTNAHAHIVGGADHYFIGRAEALMELATEFVDELVSP